MSKKKRGPGRPKGSRNKRTNAVMTKVEELGCDPIEGICACIEDLRAAEPDPVERAEALLRFYKSLLPHYAPALKAVELSANQDESRPLVEIRLVKDPRPSGKPPALAAAGSGSKES